MLRDNHLPRRVQYDTSSDSVSARHIHLKQQHVEALFGEGYQLHVLKDLSQPGQYACEETVEVIGQRLFCECENSWTCPPHYAV